MRYFFLIFLLIPLALSGQDKKVTALPADTVVQGTDLLYIIDQGTTSKKMTMTRMLNVMNDTADVVRGEMADTAAALRGEITGAAGWTKVGNDVHFTDADDSLTIGTSTNASAKLLVNGNIKASDNISTMDSIKLVGPYNTYSGKLYSSGDNLMLYDDNTGAVSLSTLMSGSLFSLNGTTRYPTLTTDNWNFGGSTTTTYKVKVTGDFGVTGIIYLGTNLSFMDYSTTGTIFNLPNSKAIWMTARALSIGYAANLTSSGLSVNPVSYLPSAPSNGDMFNKSGSLLFYDGAEWDTLNPVNTLAGGLEISMDECSDCDTAVVAHGTSLAYRLISGFGGGTGDGTLKGTMVAGRIPFGVDSDSLTTSANLTYSNDSLTGQFLDYLIFGDGTSGEIIEMEDGHIQLTSEMSYVHLWGDASSGDSISIQADDGIFLHDSTYLEYLKGTEDNWVFLTATAAFDTGTVDNAGFILTLSPFPSIREYMADIQGEEVSWLYKDKNGVIQKSYGLPKKPMYQIQALMGGIERGYRWTLEHDQRIEVLESELRKLQKDYDDLKRDYGLRLSNMEQVIIKRLSE